MRFQSLLLQQLHVAGGSRLTGLLAVNTAVIEGAHGGSGSDAADQTVMRCYWEMIS